MLALISFYQSGVVMKEMVIKLFERLLGLLYEIPRKSLKIVLS